MPEVTFYRKHDKTVGFTKRELQEEELEEMSDTFTKNISEKEFDEFMLDFKFQTERVLFLKI